MEREVKRTSILIQVAVFFLIGVAVTGILGYFSQQLISHKSVISSTEKLSARVADEVIMSVNQYPAHEWLMNYWYEHAYDMDIEYDAPMDGNTETAKKAGVLQ